MQLLGSAPNAHDAQRHAPLYLKEVWTQQFGKALYCLRLGAVLPLGTLIKSKDDLRSVLNIPLMMNRIELMSATMHANSSSMPAE